MGGSKDDEKDPELKQGRIAGVQPKWAVELEEAQDALKKLRADRNTMQKKERELNDRCVEIVEAQGVSVRRSGNDEWYLSEGSKKWKRRRVKKAGSKGAREEKKRDSA
jgi:hypothetical protein